jgi:mono/diheme cytochrome c family protein
MNCLACHGPGAGGLIGPKLAMNPILRDHERFWQTVLEGRGAMPPWREALNLQEIADIHAWLKTLP